MPRKSMKKLMKSERCKHAYAVRQRKATERKAAAEEAAANAENAERSSESPEREFPTGLAQFLAERTAKVVVEDPSIPADSPTLKRVLANEYHGMATTKRGKIENQLALASPGIVQAVAYFKEENTGAPIQGPNVRGFARHHVKKCTPGSQGSGRLSRLQLKKPARRSAPEKDDEPEEEKTNTP